VGCSRIMTAAFPFGLHRCYWVFISVPNRLSRILSWKMVRLMKRLLQSYRSWIRQSCGETLL
jgi:hypothetical protein